MPVDRRPPSPGGGLGGRGERETEGEVSKGTAPQKTYPLTDR